MSALAPTGPDGLSRMDATGWQRELAGTLTLLVAATCLASAGGPAARFLTVGHGTNDLLDLGHAAALGVGGALVVSLLFQAFTLAWAHARGVTLERPAAYRAARRGWGPAFIAISSQAKAPLTVAACLSIALAHEALLRGIVVALDGLIGSVAAVSSGIVLALAVALSLSPAPRDAAHRGCAAVVLAIVHGSLAVLGTGLAALVVAHGVLLLVVHRA